MMGLRCCPSVLSALVGFGLSCITATAFAGEDERREDAKEAEKAKEERKRKFQFGVGVLGAVGGNFLDKPDNPGIYPGFAGANYGGGLMIDFRFIRFLGIEVDVMRSRDKGSGTITFNGVDTEWTVGQSAWHIPVFAKVLIPLPLLSPMLFAGPEFVIPGDAEVEVDGPGFVVPAVPAAAHADNYVMLAFGLGFEVKLPLPVIDLRLPFTLRGAYNLSASDDLSDRVTAQGINTEWKYQVQATLGAGLYF